MTTSWNIETLERGDVLRSETGWRIAEFIGASVMDPHLYVIIKRDLKTGKSRRAKLTLSQLQHYYPRTMDDWSNPYCN